tara:strand:+ start:3946 stop:4071 length:126 start_codon:yes stop_codon:yes gene_type:complete
MVFIETHEEQNWVTFWVTFLYRISSKALKRIYINGGVAELG